MRGFSDASARVEREFERQLNAMPSTVSIRQWHDRVASEPHVAGTDGDLRQIDRLKAAFEGMGLRTEVHEFWAYMARPVAGEVELLGDRGGPIETREAVLEEDPYSGDERLGFAWNGYSGSGDVSAAVVYANYGRAEDFGRLAELGVDVAGKVVLMRYGGLYRGNKVLNAERAGAAAVLLYTDPADSGYMKGLMYPEGGYETPTCIQRGSIKTLAYPGDPLTPGREATFNAERLDPASVGLPKIPVQPIGWAGARVILDRLDGPGVPGGWQGGLPLAYRTHGSAESCRVRVHVEQRRELVKTANVIATLPGTREPQRAVYIGCHHDAWGFGASDPTSGLICLLESARSFAEMSRRGQGPKRTIVFCAWGAEEHGIIGSVEYVEREMARLRTGAVAYINLDMAAMGADFRASASPTLRTVIAEASRGVPQARDAEQTVHDAWAFRAPDADYPGEPRFGELGGGSDHVGFWCHAGVPSAALGAGGSAGTAYHTAYDTLAWYRKVVGDDYEPALMITRMTNAVVARLAQADVLPLDPTRMMNAAEQAIGGLPAMPELGTAEAASGSGDAGGAAAGDAARVSAMARLRERAGEIASMARTLDRRVSLLARSGVLSPSAAEGINAALVDIDRAWLDDAGLPDRPWYRNLYAATDPDTGYGAWVLPGMRAVAPSASPTPEAAARVEAMAARYNAVLDRVEAALTRARDATAR